MSRPGVPVIIIDKALCKKCYNCVNVCTAFEGVYEIGEDGYPYAARPQHCVQCLICHTYAPQTLYATKTTGRPSLST